MTRNEKLTFVHELCHAIEASIRMQILSGKIPEAWDGIELRELIYEKALAARHRDFKGHGKRVSEYRNTVIVNNL